jgi:hypothetical protein
VPLFNSESAGRRGEVPRRRLGLSVRRTRTLLAAVSAAIAVLMASALVLSLRSGSGAGDTSPRPRGAGQDALPATPGSYLGVYATGVPLSYAGVTAFSNATGARKPNLVGYYSGWGEQFKTSFAETARGHGAATIVQVDPTLPSIRDIAAGRYDSYLRSFADRIRNFGHPVVLGFGHEMNADWYSWGYKHVAPATFVAAWRHIVTLFRGEGAGNVTWLWTLQADEPGTGPIASWWPGPEYVTWVGIDGYYYRPYETFASIFGKTIAEVRGVTGKPVLLSETAVGPAAGQQAKIPDLFAGMREYGTLGLVWFDISQNDGIYHQDWHLENNREAEDVFRRNVAALKLTRP